MKWKRPKIRRFSGLGDVVEALAAPVAEALDKHLGTNFSNCAGCKRRKENLNELVNFDKK